MEVHAEATGLDLTAHLYLCHYSPDILVVELKGVVLLLPTDPRRYGRTLKPQTAKVL